MGGEVVEDDYVDAGGEVIGDEELVGAAVGEEKKSRARAEGQKDRSRRAAAAPG